MTLSKNQLEDDPKVKYLKWFWIWERDLLQCARSWPAWREKAHELGFTDEKIDSPWSHPDAGRQIKYMENPSYKEKEATTINAETTVQGLSDNNKNPGDSISTESSPSNQRLDGHVELL